MWTEHKLSDWLWLGTLVLVFGLSFVWLKVTLATIPPVTTAAGRVGLGAVFLFVVMKATGERLPSFFLSAASDRRKLNPIWPYLVVITLIGLAIPQALIAWGQQYVDSGLASILMAFMPLSTVIFAALFIPEEKLTLARALGFFIGFVGICVLVGPDALLRFETSRQALLGQAAVIGGAMCYGGGAILVQRMPPIDSTVAGTAQTLISFLVLAPAALLMEQPWTLTPSALSLAALSGLGLISTGLFTYVFFLLVRSAGATFMSQTSYLGPPVAVFMGALLLGERPGANALVALGLILFGVALAQARFKAVLRRLRVLTPPVPSPSHDTLDTHTPPEGPRP